MLKNHAKIDDFGATGVPKSTKMVPRSAPKVTLEISHEKDKRITKNCEDFLRHLGDLGRHLGATRRQMAPKITQVAPKGSKKASGALTFCGPGKRLASNITFGTFLGTILVDLGWILDEF